MAKITLPPSGDGPEYKRSRERLQKIGSTSLSDQELMEIIVNPKQRTQEIEKIATDTLNVLDKVTDLVAFEELAAIKGLNEDIAAVIGAVLELARRKYYPAPHSIDKPSDAHNLLKHMANRKEENFFCITLNGAQEVINIHHISKGLVNRAIVHPREVYVCAIADRATAIVVAHNHPSGNVSPSDSDRDVTRRLLQSGQLLGIPMLDHIIFSQISFFSFLDNQELN